MWKENYCDVCERYVELAEFEFIFNDAGTAVSYVGTCKECGKVVLEGKIGHDKIRKEN